MVVMLGCFAAGAGLMALASIGVAPKIRRQRWLKFTSYLVIVFGVLGCTALGRAWLAGLVVVILAFGVRELYMATTRVRQRRSGPVWLIWMIYSLLACGLLTTALAIPTEIVAYLYLVVAAFDGFSQVAGQLFGKHPLVPAVSLAKTVEGLLGGITGAIVMALLVSELAGLSPAAASIAGIAISLCALTGDLGASWVKRLAGLKDFSGLLPGQGGMLDRFDSFICAGGLLAPVLLTLANR